MLAALSAMHTQAGTNTDAEYNKLRQAFAHMVGRPSLPKELGGGVATGAFSGSIRPLGSGVAEQASVARDSAVGAAIGRGFAAGVSDKIAEDVARLYAFLTPEQREQIATRFNTEKAQQRAPGGELIAPATTGG